MTVATEKLKIGLLLGFVPEIMRVTRNKIGRGKGNFFEVLKISCTNNCKIKSITGGYVTFSKIREGIVFFFGYVCVLKRPEGYCE